MYNTKVICTYNTDNIFLETDNIYIFEKEFIRNAIYRQELLDIFDLDECNEEEMGIVIHELYEKIKECKELKECMLKLAANFFTSDEEFGLILLFSYDYMYLSHVCISEFLETGKVSDDNLLKLKQLVN